MKTHQMLLLAFGPLAFANLLALPLGADPGDVLALLGQLLVVAWPLGVIAVNLRLTAKRKAKLAVPAPGSAAPASVPTASEELPLFVLVEDRVFEGEGLSIGMLTDTSYLFTDGDSYPVDSPSLADMEPRYLTQYQLEQELASLRRRLAAAEAQAQALRQLELPLQTTSLKETHAC